MFAPGCASSGGPIPNPQGQSSPGDAEWDDLDAAISWTATEHELGILGFEDQSPETRVYELNTLRGDPVYIQFSREEKVSPYESTPVEITVQYGFFGDERREQAIIQTLQSRLARLSAID